MKVSYKKSVLKEISRASVGSRHKTTKSDSVESAHTAERMQLNMAAMIVKTGGSYGC